MLLFLWHLHDILTTLSSDLKIKPFITKFGRLTDRTSARLSWTTNQNKTALKFLVRSTELRKACRLVAILTVTWISRQKRNLVQKEWETKQSKDQNDSNEYKQEKKET